MNATAVAAASVLSRSRRSIVATPLSRLDRRVLRVPVRMNLVLVRDRENLVVVVQIPREHGADRLRIVRDLGRRRIRCGSSSTPAASTTATRGLRLELVGNDRARMSRLRV